MANVFDPNWLQRMFTPEGYGYQWQNRPDQGGGEFTGYIPDVYEGDAQDLRMVPKIPQTLLNTPNVPMDMPGPVVPRPSSVASVPVEAPKTTGGYQGIVNEDAIPLAGFATPKPITIAGRNLNPRIWPQHSPIRNPAAVPSSGVEPTRPPAGPTTPPRGMGTAAATSINPALEAQRFHASQGRGSTTVDGRRYTGTHPRNTGGEPLNTAESESQRWQREVEARRAGRAGAIPVVEPKVGASVSGGAPGSVSKFWGEGFMRRSVPGWLGAKGAELVGEGSKWLGRLSKGAGAALGGTSRLASAAMYANLMAEIMGTEDLPDWAQAALGQRTGLLNRDLSPDEQLEENVRLSDLASVAENKGNIELANEIRSQIQHDNLTGLGFALDPRAWAESDVLGNMKSYYGNMFSNMFTPDEPVTTSVGGMTGVPLPETQQLSMEDRLRSQGMPEFKIRAALGGQYRGI